MSAARNGAYPNTNWTGRWQCIASGIPKKGASYLEAKDVNAIVELATYGLLKLELSEFPLYKQR